MKGLGELALFMHHVWKPQLFLGPFAASPSFVNNSKKKKNHEKTTASLGH